MNRGRNQLSRKNSSERIEEYDFFLENWLKKGDSKKPFSTTDEKGALIFILREKIWEWIDGDTVKSYKF